MKALMAIRITVAGTKSDRKATDSPNANAPTMNGAQDWFCRTNATIVVWITSKSMERRT